MLSDRAIHDDRGRVSPSEHPRRGTVRAWSAAALAALLALLFASTSSVLTSSAAGLDASAPAPGAMGGVLGRAPASDLRLSRVLVASTDVGASRGSASPSQLRGGPRVVPRPAAHLSESHRQDEAPRRLGSVELTEPKSEVCEAEELTEDVEELSAHSSEHEERGLRYRLARSAPLPLEGRPHPSAAPTLPFGARAPPASLPA